MAQTAAGDLHDLVKWHEARNVALVAEVVYRSALDRRESREQFYREDYPMTDPDWFCWHGVSSTGEGLRFDRQAFPSEGMRFFPKHQQSGLGPIGVIMSAKHQTTKAD